MFLYQEVALITFSGDKTISGKLMINSWETAFWNIGNLTKGNKKDTIGVLNKYHLFFVKNVSLLKKTS